MSSKKHRKKLKEQYNPRNKKKYYTPYLLTDEAKHDRESILTYLKSNPNRTVSSTELMRNAYLLACSRSTISRNISYIKEYEDSHVITVSCRGYMYVE